MEKLNETPKPLTDEQKEDTKDRIISDARFIRDGADIRDDGSLKVTRTQFEEAKQEMEGPYYDEATINGINYIVKWDKEYRGYVIYFPDIVINKASFNRGVYHQEIVIDSNREEAKKVFDHTGEIAKGENDVYEVNKKLKEYLNEEQHTRE